MGSTASTEPRCLYKGALYLTVIPIDTISVKDCQCCLTPFLFYIFKSNKSLFSFSVSVSCIISKKNTNSILHSGRQLCYLPDANLFKKRTADARHKNYRRFGCSTVLFTGHTERNSHEFLHTFLPPSLSKINIFVPLW
jgi:hypothetical protein